MATLRTSVRAASHTWAYFLRLWFVRAHSQSDVDLIASEMELSKEVSERKLREHKGDVVATLNTLVAA